MFESLKAPVLKEGQTPIEFIYRGKRLRIYTVLSRWRESGGWWKKSDGENNLPTDNSKEVWRVEAAPIGVINTFEIERDETTGLWSIRVI
jgi:hypothetical protein